MRVQIFLFIQLAPWSARRHHYTVTSSITHTWLICSHVSLSQSMMSFSCLLACYQKSQTFQEMSWNVWSCGHISPGEAGWCIWAKNAMLHEKAIPRCMASGGFFILFSWQRRKKGERKRGLSLESQLLLISWPPPTLSHYLCHLKVRNMPGHF